MNFNRSTIRYRKSVQNYTMKVKMIYKLIMRTLIEKF